VALAAKEFYFHCLEKMKVKPSESMYVGDRIDKDILPAREIGMKTVLIHRGGKYDPIKRERSLTQNFPKADHEINNLYELFACI